MNGSVTVLSALIAITTAYSSNVEYHSSRVNDDCCVISQHIADNVRIVKSAMCGRDESEDLRYSPMLLYVQSLNKKVQKQHSHMLLDWIYISTDCSNEFLWIQGIKTEAAKWNYVL